MLTAQKKLTLNIDYRERNGKGVISGAARSGRGSGTSRR